MMHPHILVLGTGSVGKRHLNNFKNLGCKLSAMDPRADRLREAAEITPLIDTYRSVDAIDGHWAKYDGVVVCSPPKYHVQQSRGAIDAGVPVLLEKPVSPGLEEACALQEALLRHGSGKLLLGYTYRWWKPLRLFKEKITEVGKPLHAKFVMSAHLADWHPWESYRDFFMSSADLGGGALLDESHFLDLMLWFFGMPEKLYGKVDRLSELNIDSDDNVDILATFSSGLRVSIHLDLFGRPHQKYISISGDGGTIEWSFEPNRVRVSDQTANHQWRETVFEEERNDMFVAVAADFLEMIANDTQPSCGIGDGVAVMQLVEACRLSTETSREISLRQEIV